MRGVDLARWRFDWDLTFAVVVAHPDGTILHRYGGRDARGADRFLSIASYRRFLEAGLASHAAHAPREEALPEPVSLDQVPAFAARDKGECIHCHSVNPGLREQAREEDRWRDDDLWVYPPPGRVGIDLDRDDQQLVTAVEEGSAAADAGLRVRDRIERVGEVAVATASDLMHALHVLPPEGGEVPVRLARGPASLSLAPGWKRASPAAFAWRPSKWGLLPAPGFGGPQLDEDDLARLGLPPDTFAFRVGYRVTWGPQSRLGRHAARMGLREGMVVLGTSAKRDFQGIDHFHAWWRLKLEVGQGLDVIVWEDGEERRLAWTVAG